MLNLQHVFRLSLDGMGDCLPVGWANNQCLSDQQVQIRAIRPKVQLLCRSPSEDLSNAPKC